MTAISVDLLRLVLPPCRANGPAPVRCAWRVPRGPWQSGFLADLDEVAARFRPRRVEACPHPADLSMTEAELPPLPAAKRRPAVQGAVELLALAPPASLAIGFGPRGDAGRVPIAWMAAGQLAGWQGQLAANGLRVDAVYPPPAFLPLPHDAGPDGAASAAIIDDWVVVRTGPDSGALYPLPSRCSEPGQLQARIQAAHPAVGRLQWHHPDGAGDDEPPWSGAGWSWGLPLGHGSSRTLEHSWLRPALAWGAAAALVGLVGLNLHAHRIASEGQTLKREMAAQVKAAFPEVPVVLNPLQQARQLRDARNAGTGSAAADDFAALLRTSTTLLAQSAGQVERVDFQGGRLRLRWREGAMLKASEVEALQAQAAERGLAIESDKDGLRVRAAAASPEPSP
ncbi:type II secretion system protein GspL [Pseudothauera rhizosphaerae]|uniref:GspL periplasmic domain-containing protein n=1 Tax=Pseudothauera rhizosphaerae TaxID=2565932 RepID=A0A4S4ALS7_9RHOO|nr:type II secretion system protein GspL [Pseudothauera rhizosphaerae]THF60462.1 hypothetical protein E6O51_13355 [Pseudothauera rhizosphaerae]